MEVAVVGAGIVGACTAWALARQGAEVTLYERGQPMGETSRASSKLLHGGLRYLETGQFRLVGKALHARTDWLELAPHLCHRLEMLLPMYRDKGRSQFTISAGIRIYDVLAMGSGFPRARALKPSEVLALQPGLSPDGLVGAWAFFDAQMDDHALGNWVIEQFRQLGGELVTDFEVRDLAVLDGFDRIVNATGPWAMQLRETAPGKPSYTLDWVRGSHIVLDRVCPAAMLLEVPGSSRIFFVLPYKGRTLIGTTEVRQSGPNNPGPSEDEIRYLLDAHNHYLAPAAMRCDVVEAFSGVRPLLRSADNPSEATREWAFERTGNVLHIYGGKWTTAKLQGDEAANRILQ
ncbi:glycerol-3-phosphate dehydrogenase/oxidase [Thauera sp. SWB20]|uniref:glycerol-3-phosphate dehydrogenase/oxidase n=1 Tax=Thauera sp. SWB20 TaxID=1572758 RepID=UPI0005ADDAAB|nr:FAD-dependent oxidoreductase [Thauera sp. SWB20]KIN89476.1 ketopantoate reductase PanE/ApbA family protein [Thauera sp. SWB20]